MPAVRSGLRPSTVLKLTLFGFRNWLYRRVDHVNSHERLYAQVVNAYAQSHRLVLPIINPVHGSASYGLLYALIRIVTEMPVSNILDVGAGTSSVLLDVLLRDTDGVVVTSLESDAAWAARVAAKVNHDVLLMPLVQRTQANFVFSDYERWPAGPFDLVVIDGPAGTPRRSRWGTLGLLDGRLAEDFVVVFDDAERQGEIETIRTFAQHLSHQGVEFSTHAIHGAKSQVLFYTKRYSLASTL